MLKLRRLGIKPKDWVEEIVSTLYPIIPHYVDLGKAIVTSRVRLRRTPKSVSYLV